MSLPFKGNRTRQSGGVVAKLCAVAALVVAIVAMTVAPVSGAAINADATNAAKSGRDWIGQWLEQGIPVQVFGSPSWGATVDAGIALVAVDSDDPRIDDIWQALIDNREAVVNDGAADVPGALAKLILLAHSIGENPRSVGTGPGADLVTRLRATMQPSGLFGTQTPTYDGVFRQGLSLTALAAAGETPDLLAVQWILDQQCQGAFDGAWMSYRADTTMPCVEDQASFSGPGSDAVASAIIALVEAAGDDPVAKSAVEDALVWLDGAQKADGGWGLLPWLDSDPNSIAGVVSALIATGDLNDPRFADKSASPVEALLSFQLGVDAPPEEVGAFTYPGTAGAPSELATLQSVPAAAGRSLIFIGESAKQPESSTTTTTTTQPSAPTTVATTKVTAPPPGNSAEVLRSSTARSISFTG